LNFLLCHPKPSFYENINFHCAKIDGCYIAC